MMNQSADSPNQTANASGLNPQQFALSEFLWLTIGSAVVLAIVSPFLRMLSSQALLFVSIMASLQAIVSSAVVYSMSRRRNRMLAVAGSFLGLGCTSESRRGLFSMTGAVVSLFLYLSISGILIVVVASEMSKRQSLNVGQMIVVGLFLTAYSFLFSHIPLIISIRYFRWRLSPNTVEFFENGLASRDNLVPWKRLEVRPSQTAAERIAVVITSDPIEMGMRTIMIWVDETLKHELIARSIAANENPSTERPAAESGFANLPLVPPRCE